MTIYSNFSYFRKLNYIAPDRTFFKLRKQKGLISAVFFISGKPVTTIFKSLPGVMQSFNHILGYLRMDGFIPRICLFPLGELPLLLQVTRELNIGRHDIFAIQRARVQTTFSRSNPILKVAQTSVIESPARLKPSKHQFLLLSSWINSICVIHSQHTCILVQVMAHDKNPFLQVGTGDS